MHSAPSTLALCAILSLAASSARADDPPAAPAPAPATDKPKPPTIDLKKAAAKPRVGPSSAPISAPRPAAAPEATPVPAPIALPDTAPGSVEPAAAPIRRPPSPINTGSTAQVANANPITAPLTEWVSVPAPQGTPSAAGRAVVLAPNADRVTAEPRFMPTVEAQPTKLAPMTPVDAPAQLTPTESAGPSITIQSRPLSARVIRTWGEANIRSGDTWLPLSADQSFSQVLTLKTTGPSGVELELDNRARLTLEGPAAVTVQRMQIEGVDAGPGRTVIQLDEGHITVNPGVPGPEGRRLPIAVRCSGQVLLVLETTEVWREADGSVRTRVVAP